MTMAQQTMGNVFADLKVTRIPGTTKGFHAMTFTFKGRKMVIGHSKTEGAKFFWYVEGRGNRELSKSEFWKWMKGFDGSDARKIAGYAKLMEPVSLGPVVDVCECGRGIDYRTQEYSTRKYGRGLCKSCQKQEVKAATNGSGRDTIMGVPVFRKSELAEMKPVQLAGVLSTIERALNKAEGDIRYKLACYADTVTAYLNPEETPSEAASISDDQREEPAETTGVKVGSEEVHSAIKLLRKRTVKQLRDTAKGRGIMGASKMKKDQLIAAIYATMTGAQVSTTMPF